MISELTKGTVEAIGVKALEEKKSLKIKLGADPSRPDLHLGHYIVLRQLRRFQDMGHRICFIIGDFTAMIGDPTGRNETRPVLSSEEVEKNAKTYKEQIFRFLNPESTEIIYNSSWLKALTPEEMIRIMGSMTVARMLERDDFSKRYHGGVSISLHEFLYPLFQGYDSVAINADVEVGGTDQTFNLLVGRKLQEDFDQKPQAVLTYPLLEGLDGKLKMSKSYGNAISFMDSPKDVFGKIMGISDELMWRYFQILLEKDAQEVTKWKSSSRNPRDYKMELAQRVVEILYSSTVAAHAYQEFERIFRNRGTPDEMPSLVFPDGEVDLVNFLKVNGVVASTSEGRRLLKEGAISLDGEKVTTMILLLKAGVLKVGKKRFYRLESQ